MAVPKNKPEAIVKIQTFLEGKDPGFFRDGLFLPLVAAGTNITVFIPWQAWTLSELREMPTRIAEGIKEGFLRPQSRFLEPGSPSVFGLELDEDSAVYQYFGYKRGMETTLAFYKELKDSGYYDKQDEFRRGRRKPEQD